MLGFDSPSLAEQDRWMGQEGDKTMISHLWEYQASLRRVQTGVSVEDGWTIV